MLEGHFDRILNRKIVRVRRINYVWPDGYRNTREGPLEIELEGGLVIRFESGSDGESIRFRVGAWVDPFAGPLSEENRQFIKEAGKWSVFDLSDSEAYRLLVGKCIRDFDLIISMGKFVGIGLVVGNLLLKAEVEADELLVDLLPRVD